MPVRATKRGAARHPFDPGADADVVICGASFAGLTVARELRATGARVLLLDRYELGERQTSACAAPTEWLHNMGVEASIRQTFGSLLVHTPRVARARWTLPWTFSTFDYRQLCELLFEQAGEARFDTAKVQGRTGSTVHTDRGDVTAPLIVDALGWRRVLGAGENVQPPEAALSRGLEVHPTGAGADLELWIDPRYVDAGYGWSFPARDELRIGVGSFDPYDPVKQPTLRLVEDVAASPDGYQGNWIPHRLRPAVEDGVFFAGDSAGHCLPLTAEGIRTAFYFGIACGRELRAVLADEQDREQALAAYAAFSAAHAPTYRLALALQRLIPALPPRLLTAVLAVMGRERPCRRAFDWYLDRASPDFARRLARPWTTPSPSTSRASSPASSRTGRPARSSPSPT
jgi:flavin-dependent dehydrogenase